MTGATHQYERVIVEYQYSLSMTAIERLDLIQLIRRGAGLDCYTELNTSQKLTARDALIALGVSYK